MKIRYTKLKKNKLLKLSFLKNKIYKKTNNNFLISNEILLRFKQSLQIIYKYHINKKKILFIGFPPKLNYKFNNILKNTNHILISNFFWINGLLTNYSSCLKYYFRNQNSINNLLSKIIFKFNKKIDLIVLLNSNYKKNILNESYTAKIPIIVFDNFSTMFDLKSSYKIIGNFKFSQKNNNNNFFYSIFNSIFKKANNVKPIKKTEILPQQEKRNFFSFIFNKNKKTFNKNIRNKKWKKN